MKLMSWIRIIGKDAKTIHFWAKLMSFFELKAKFKALRNIENKIK